MLDLTDGIQDFTGRLLESGYITHARVSNQTRGILSDMVMKTNNIYVGIAKRLGRFKSSLLPVFSRSSLQSVGLQCLPAAATCKWLHLCFRKGPYGTTLEPLHICKDDGQNEFTDATFFRALRKSYYAHRTWKEKALFKLKKIEFVEVRSAFPAPI